MATQIYNPKTATWTDSESGMVIDMYCGEDFDDIGMLVASVAMNPDLAQKTYVELCKIVRGAK